MVNSKRKGNAGERSWAKFLREQNLDNRAWRNYGSGSTSYKSDVVNKLGYNFEVKVGKHFSLSKAIKQTKRDAEMSHTKSAIPFHLDGMRDDEWWIIIDAYNFADLLKRAEESKLKKLDRNMKYKLKYLKNSINQVLKEL